MRLWHHENFPEIQSAKVNLLIFGEWKRALTDSRKRKNHRWEENIISGAGNAPTKIQFAAALKLMIQDHQYSLQLSI